MKILALETSTHACSAALLEGTADSFASIERFELAPRNHTQLILPMIDSVLDEAGYTIQQIDVLAYGRGPGAFTGVRVATGVVQAIAYGADLPVAQISSLAGIAQGVYREQHQAHSIKQILVANDARMGEVYFAAYEANNGFMMPVTQEQVIKPEALLALLKSGDFCNTRTDIAVGTGWFEYQEQLGDIASGICSFEDNYEYPHAKDIAYLAFKESSAQTLVSSEQVRPVYLRDNVAQKPKQII